MNELYGIQLRCALVNNYNVCVFVCSSDGLKMWIKMFPVSG